MAESYPMNRLDTIVNGLQELVPIAEERSPMMRDGKKIEAVQKLDQARRCIDKLDGMIDLKDDSLRPEQPWKSDMDRLQKVVNKVDESFARTHAAIDKLSTCIDNLSTKQTIQDSAISILAAGQARVEAKVDKLIRMQGYDPANFIDGPEIMNNATGTPQDSPPPKRKRGRPKKGEEVHKKPDTTPEYIANVVTEVLQQKGLLPTYPPHMSYMYPQMQMFYPSQQGYMSQPIYNTYTNAPIQQPTQFSQQFYPYPQAQPVPQESIKSNTTCSGVRPKNPNKNELDRYDLDVDYYAPPEELLQEAPKKAKKKNDKPSTPQEEDVIIPEPIAPIPPEPVQSNEQDSKEIDSPKDEDRKDKPQGGTPVGNQEPTAPEESQVDETVDLFRGSINIDTHYDNPITTTNVDITSYGGLSYALQQELMGAAYVLSDGEGSEKSIQHVRAMMNIYHMVTNGVETWHKFSAKDKKQILKAYSVTLKKFSSMKFDNYPGFEEVFKLINYWFQRRFPIGTKNNFRYNPSCIPGWVEDIVMVLGNSFNTMWWKDKVEEFKRWCDGCQDKRCHYALPPTLMDELRLQTVKANRNLMIWDIMNEVGFFKYLNSMLPDVVHLYYDVISWVWPQYALRYRLDCQDPKDEDFDVDDCSDPDLPAMMYAKIGRYTPGYSFTESNLSNFGWVPREEPKAHKGVKKFLIPFMGSTFNLYAKCKSNFVNRKYGSIHNAMQVCY